MQRPPCKAVLKEGYRPFDLNQWARDFCLLIFCVVRGFARAASSGVMRVPSGRGSKPEVATGRRISYSRAHLTVHQFTTRWPILFPLLFPFPSLPRSLPFKIVLPHGTGSASAAVQICGCYDLGVLKVVTATTRGS